LVFATVGRRVSALTSNDMLNDWYLRYTYGQRHGCEVEGNVYGDISIASMLKSELSIAGGQNPAVRPVVVEVAGRFRYTRYHEPVFSGHQ
jgi:hypothetical protein